MWFSSVLVFVSSHFRVAEKEPVNKMSLHNLATVFGPTLLRPSESEINKAHITLASDIWSHDVMAQVSPGLHTHCSLSGKDSWSISQHGCIIFHHNGLWFGVFDSLKMHISTHHYYNALWLFHHLDFRTVITHWPQWKSTVLGIFSSLVYLCAHVSSCLSCEWIWRDSLAVDVGCYGLFMIYQKLNEWPEPNILTCHNMSCFHC